MVQDHCKVLTYSTHSLDMILEPALWLETPSSHLLATSKHRRMLICIVWAKVAHYFVDGIEIESVRLTYH